MSLSSLYSSKRIPLPDIWSYPFLLFTVKENFFSAAGMVSAYSHIQGRAATNFPPKGNYRMALQTSHSIYARGLTFRNAFP